MRCHHCHLPHGKVKPYSKNDKINKLFSALVIYYWLSEVLISTDFNILFFIRRCSQTAASVVVYFVLATFFYQKTFSCWLAHAPVLHKFSPKTYGKTNIFAKSAKISCYQKNFTKMVTLFHMLQTSFAFFVKKKLQEKSTFVNLRGISHQNFA